MEEAYEYKCPNCGARVEFNKEINKWVCAYCNGTFDKLYEGNEGKELDGANTKLNTYYYYCESCSNSFYATQNYSACPKCNQHITKTESKLDDIISTSFSSEVATNAIAATLAPFVSQFNIDLSNLDKKIVIEYIKCSIFNGSINISNGTNSTSYVFINYVYPYLENPNYKVLYDFANQGFISGKNSMNSMDSPVNGNYRINKKENDRVVDVEGIRKKIIDECINIFSSQYGNNNIKVEDLLNCKKDVLYEVHYFPFIYEGKEYRTYYIDTFDRGYKKFSLTVSTGRKNGIVSADIPKDKSISISSITIPKKIAFIFIVLAVVLLAFAPIFLFFQTLLMTEMIPSVLLIALIVIAVISLVIAKVLFNKSDRNSLLYEVDEKQYYRNVILNSNYVKVISEVRK